MTARSVPGVSRIGIRTADGCFYPLMLESFRGVRELVLTTTNSEQKTVDVDFFMEEPGGGDRYQHLGTVRLHNTEFGGSRPDLVLRVSLAAGHVLTAVLTGPAGQGNLRVALQRYSFGKFLMRIGPDLPRTLETVAAGLLDGEPRKFPAPAAAAWRAAGGRIDDERATSLARFVHRSISTMPINALPYDPARILWLAQRADLNKDEAELVRSVCRHLINDPDSAGANVTDAVIKSAVQHADENREEPEILEPSSSLPVREAFLQRDYGRVLRLLNSTHQTSPTPGITSEITNYWLDE